MALTQASPASATFTLLPVGLLAMYAAGRLLIGVVQVGGHGADRVLVADIGRVQATGRAGAAAKDRRIGVSADIAIRRERLRLDTASIALISPATPLSKPAKSPRVATV